MLHQIELINNFNETYHSLIQDNLGIGVEPLDKALLSISLSEPIQDIENRERLGSVTSEILFVQELEVQLIR